MVNHKYSSYTLIFLLILLFVTYALASFGTDDIDELCDQATTTLTNINGTWQCNTQHYSELYWYNNSNNKSLTITNIETYYQLTNIQQGLNSGMNQTTTNITITKAALYSIQTAFSFDGGGSSIYEGELFLNGAGSDKCEWHRKMGAGGDVGSASFTCLLNLTIGDTLDLRFKDKNNPAQDIHFHSLNLNIIEVQPT